MSDLSRLAACENVIKRTKQSAMEFVAAVREIKDNKLWLEAVPPAGEAEYANFDDYSQRRLGFTRNYANRLIKAAEVQATVPIGTDLNEAQARELASVPEEQRESVLEAAAEATDGKPTARAIREAKERIVDVEPVEPDESHQDGDKAEVAKTDQPDPEWKWIADEAEEIARDIGNHERMATFLNEIAGKVRENGIVAAARLENIAMGMRT